MSRLQQVILATSGRVLANVALGGVTLRDGEMLALILQYDDEQRRLTFDRHGVQLHEVGERSALDPDECDRCGHLRHEHRFHVLACELANCSCLEFADQDLALEVERLAAALHAEEAENARIRDALKYKDSQIGNLKSEMDVMMRRLAAGEGAQGPLQRLRK